MTICQDCYANYGGAPGTVLCPLHEATADLLAAAKVALESLRAWNAIENRNFDEDMKQALIASYEASPELQKLKAAIAKAEQGR